MSQTERHYKINHLLALGKCLGKQRLLDQLGVSPATLKRDLAYLRDRMIALGNALRAAPGAGLQDDAARNRIHQGLRGHANNENVLVRESVLWALAQA